MSITHSISNHDQPAGASSYTIVGGRPSPEKSPNEEDLSIIIFNRRTGPFRETRIDALSQLNAREIFLIESAPGPNEALAMVKRYRNLRFLVFPNDVNTGTRINTAISEASSIHCLVMPEDTQLDFTSPAMQKVLSKNQLCSVPILLDKDGNILPTAVGPMPDVDSRFQALPTAPGKGDSATLLPWDFCGIYLRDKHLTLGGFDQAIGEDWWQLLEYGMRAWLWGEEISIDPACQVRYLTDPPATDMSPRQGYRRFFLKIIAVQRHGGIGRLTRFQWWAYLRDSRDSSATASADWKDISRWVQRNRHRFVMDAKELTANWQWTQE